MKADWYVDPLGRFDGRFFDGQHWTDKVSAGGKLSQDADWPQTGSTGAPADPVSQARREAEAEAAREAEAEAAREARAAQEAEAAREAQAAQEAEAEAAREAQEARETEAELARGAVRDAEAKAKAARVGDALAGSESGFDDNATPAVESAPDPIGRKASLVTESPGRAVAVLDDRAGPASPKSDDAVRRRWMYTIGVLALLAGLALLVVPRLVGDDESPDTGATPESASAAEAGTAEEVTPTLAPPDSVLRSFDAADALGVGPLTIVNGRSALADLSDWHQGYATGDELGLAPDAGCWFASFDGAAVENAYCGPLTGGVDTDLIFHQVPLRFTDIDADRIVVEALTDGAIDESFVANGIELIGLSEPPAPDPDSSFGTRGERTPTD